MNFLVLSAEGPDAAQWHAVLERFPLERRDLHYSPSYGLVYRDTYGHEPMLAVAECDGVAVMHAFVRRPLDDLACVQEAGAAGRYTDVATPYGFGGPLHSAPTDAEGIALLQYFDARWRDWCAAERIPAEFVCLHPLLGNASAVRASGIADPAAAKDVVVIDLTGSEDQLWARVSRGTRSSIQRARREGVVVERVDADLPTLEAFQRLYLATMARLGATARWLFPPRYFRSCAERLGAQGCALFFARCRGELAAAYLLILDGRTAYYHFGASDERWLALRPNNLLMYETLLWAKRRGCVRYHLGGGVTSDGNDSLLRFKSSFGGVRVPLYTYGRVHCTDTYREVCELKQTHEARHGIVPAAPDYFPRYRR